jgi:hypothetical protein
VLLKLQLIHRMTLRLPRPEILNLLMFGTLSFLLWKLEQKLSLYLSHCLLPYNDVFVHCMSENSLFVRQTGQSYRLPSRCWLEKTRHFNPRRQL